MTAFFRTLLATRLIRLTSGFERPQAALNRVPQISASETGPIDIGIRLRCDTICATGRPGYSCLSEPAKTERFPFPFPWGAIGGKWETAGFERPDGRMD
jgi:hypothetical protein